MRLHRRWTAASSGLGGYRYPDEAIAVLAASVNDQQIDAWCSSAC
ncbi:MULTISPECIES: hypothetical protein [Amycolatopsis]|uniref:Uncharacterized protein n=1 Tax=Amycolatopsis albidoflavus TaxID=102226 RepID=A0ABW5HRM4_9PSEU